MSEESIYLTNKQLVGLCPSIGYLKPTRPVSEKYVHIPTLQVVDDLRKFGWKPTHGAQRGDGFSQFSKHEVIMEHPDLLFKVGDDEMKPRIHIMNSHDGLQSFRFYVGIFRFICSNGLVIPASAFGQELGSALKIRHIHYNLKELKSTLKKQLVTMQHTLKVILALSKRTLTDVEKETFAKLAYMTRSKVKIEDAEEFLKGISKETVDSLLESDRKEDEGDDAWRVFNRVQEKIINGGFIYSFISKSKGEEGETITDVKMRKAKALKGFEKKNRVNLDLFTAMLGVSEVEVEVPELEEEYSEIDEEIFE